MASKEIDRWLKAKIEKVPEDIIKFRDKKLESKMVYYTGNWQIDIMANLTQRQSEKIFNKMQKIHNDGGLLFFQRRMKQIKIGAPEYDDAEVIQGYEYIVMRGKK